MVIAVLLTILAAGGDVAKPDEELSKNGMYCFELPKAMSMGDTQVRKPHPESRDLLIARGGANFYDHEKKTLTLVKSSRWKEAKGVVTDYASFGPRDENVRALEQDYKLILWDKRTGDRQIPTKGAWVMRVGLSVEGKLFPALTRDKKPEKGMKEPSAHYIELFTYPEGTPVGEAYELPFTDFLNIEPVCWSSGDTYLVVSTEDGKQVCIIEVPEQAEEKK